MSNTERYSIVLYAGDVACGSPDTWQIWPSDQLDSQDSRILESHPIVNWAQYIDAQEVGK
jgi:hypothetical protein